MQPCQFSICDSSRLSGNGCACSNQQWQGRDESPSIAGCSTLAPHQVHELSRTWYGVNLGSAQAAVGKASAQAASWKAWGTYSGERVVRGCCDLGVMGGCVDRLAVQVVLGHRHSVRSWATVHVLEQLPRHHVVARAHPELGEALTGDVFRQSINIQPGAARACCRAHA